MCSFNQWKRIDGGWNKYKSSHELCAHICLLNFHAIPKHTFSWNISYWIERTESHVTWVKSLFFSSCKFLWFSTFLFRKMQSIFHIVYTSIGRTFVNQSNLFLFINWTANESFTATCNWPLLQLQQFRILFQIYWWFKNCSPRSISIYLHFKSSYRNKWIGGIFVEWLWLPLPNRNEKEKGRLFFKLTVIALIFSLRFYRTINHISLDNFKHRFSR